MNHLTLPEAWLDRRINILIAGAGGTGSQVIDQIASLDATLRALGHPGFNVTLADPDTVSRWNLGRQRFTAADVSLHKSLVLVHRINNFYGVNYQASTSAVSAKDARRYDLIITCTDSAKFRGDLWRHYHSMSTSTLWLDYGNGNAGGQVILGHLGKHSGDRLPNVVDLYPSLAEATTTEDDQPSCSMHEALQKQPWPANRAVAIAGISMLERLIRTGQLTFHGVIVQLDPYTVTPISIDPAQWSLFGYTPNAARRSKRGKAAA